MSYATLLPKNNSRTILPFGIKKDIIFEKKPMSNKLQFFQSYLNGICRDYNIPRDIAFEVFSISVVLNKTFSEVFEKILIYDKNNPKNGSDGGIDGIYFEENSDTYDMHVFQCKNTAHLKMREIEKLRNDIREIFEDGNVTNKPHAELLSPYLDEYKQITDEKKIVSIKSYFLFNGDKGEGGNKQLYLKFHEPAKDTFIYDSGDLFDMLSRFADKKRKEVKFTFKPVVSTIAPANDAQSIYTFFQNDIKAANFRIYAKDLCELMDKEIQENGKLDLLFQENIRDYLGIDAKTNKRINETLHKSEESILFPFLNNGITIICDELNLPPKQNNSYLLPVVNPQIVNGLQTSRVLYYNYKKSEEEGIDYLENVTVNVRVYGVKDKDIIDKITDATNTQTPINFRDKISTKEYNKYIEILFKNANINYISKRRESFRNKNIYQETIESETAMQFWYATIFEKPEVAKNSIAKVMQDIFEASTDIDNPLNIIFNGDKNSVLYKQLLIAYKIYRVVTNRKKEQAKKNEFVSHADQLLSYGIYKYIGVDLDKYNDDSINTAYDKAVKIIAKLITAEKKKYSDLNLTFSFSSYFKKPKCRLDYNAKVGIIEDINLITTLKNIK